MSKDNYRSTLSSFFSVVLFQFLTLKKGCSSVNVCAIVCASASRRPLLPKSRESFLLQKVVLPLSWHRICQTRSARKWNLLPCPENKSQTISAHHDPAKLSWSHGAKLLDSMGASTQEDQPGSSGGQTISLHSNEALWWNYYWRGGHVKSDLTRPLWLL